MGELKSRKRARKNGKDRKKWWMWVCLLLLSMRCSWPEARPVWTSQLPSRWEEHLRKSIQKASQEMWILSLSAPTSWSDCRLPPPHTPPGTAACWMTSIHISSDEGDVKGMLGLPFSIPQPWGKSSLYPNVQHHFLIPSWRVITCPWSDLPFHCIACVHPIPWGI